MLQVFRDDDTGYEAWLSKNPGGFVLNVQRNPGRSYLKAHTARCFHVTNLQPGYSTWTTSDYFKVCATSAAELDQWAQETTGGTIERSCSCWGPT